MREVSAAHFDDWRTIARRLLAESVPPEGVRWLDSAGGERSLWDGVADRGDRRADDLAAEGTTATVPREFLGLATEAACHRAADRWERLYRILWRLTHGEPHLLRVTTDDDVRRLQLLSAASGATRTR